MGRRLVAILAAAVVALVGVAAVLLYAKSADSRAISGLAPEQIFVAKQMVPAGTALKDALNGDLIVKTTLPAKATPVGALSAVDDTNANLLALSDIQPGEYLQSSRFGQTPLGNAALTVPKGQVAISIQLDDPARVATFLTPGSRIVLIDSWDAGATGASAIDKKHTRALLDDVYVLAVGGASLTPSTGDGTQATSTTLVTIAVTSFDAVKVVHALKTGELYAALRGADVTVDLGRVISNESTLFAKK